ncbi:MAG: ImmA/IrrE family metallo-endopeptidase [Lachnospiraceae bacterium]|nr:ImmA/IrrE family metallo-endopeptidase [Lachnospiraceae bacterium]
MKKKYNSQSHEEAMKDITDKLEKGVEELFESERYKNYLKCMSKFHNYSLNNTILIAMQKPDATLVAGYQSWQKDHGRFVKKGEKGIRILAPTPYKVKMEQEKKDPVSGCTVIGPDGKPETETVEVKRAAFRITTVFDVSQTEGKELPSIGVNELMGQVDGYEKFLAALQESSPVPVGFEDIASGSKGYFHVEDNRIAVQENMSELQTVKTLIHEIAHAKLHSIKDRDVMESDNIPKKDRRTKEVEALY